MKHDSNDYVIRVLDSPDGISAAAWNKLLSVQPQATPFMRHEYLSALQHSGSATPLTGWTPRFILVQRERLLVAACALYVKTHSWGEYVFDQAWANAYQQQQQRQRYYPKASVAVPFTPVSGSRLLARSEADRALLCAAVVNWCESEGLSSLHVLFADAADSAACANAGLLLRHGVQFHWTNATPAFVDFERFLASLTQEKRKKIRQERRKVAEAGVSLRWSLGAAIAQSDWDFFYRCYENTYREHGNAPYLTRDFFRRVANTMPQNWLLFVAQRNGQPIAASLIAVTGEGAGDQDQPHQTRGIAYGRYWGALEHVDCLHFEACYYQPLAWCIAHGYQRFEGGAQGEHKMARALLPVKTTSAHWLADPAFFAALERFLQRERQAVGQYLDDLHQRNPLRQRAGN